MVKLFEILSATIFPWCDNYIKFMTDEDAVVVGANEIALWIAGEKNEVCIEQLQNLLEHSD